MLTTREIRRLHAATAGGQVHAVAAASGCVLLDSRLFVVADDELHLASFGPFDHAPGQLWRVFDGALPDDPHERKAAKPDLESLARAPAGSLRDGPVLLAVGSGSTPARRRGAVVALREGLPGVVAHVDFAAVFAALAGDVPQPNIEGAVVDPRRLLLFQRGNGRDNTNAVIELALAAVREAIARESPVPGSAVVRVVPCDLGSVGGGSVGGVPLGFTDATSLPDGRLLFCAAAEDSPDTYRDGQVAGLALGVLDASLALDTLHPLAAHAKVEGVAVESADPNAARVLLVTDADCPGEAAWLLSATVPL